MLHYLTFFLCSQWTEWSHSLRFFLMYCTPGQTWACGQIQYWIMAKLSRKERLPKMVRKRFIALLSRHGESNDALGTRGYETITMQNDSLCGPICLVSYLLGKVSFFNNLEFWKQAFIIHQMHVSKLIELLPASCLLRRMLKFWFLVFMYTRFNVWISGWISKPKFDH